MALLNRGRLFGSDPLRHTAAAMPAAADAVGHDYVDAADDEHEADAILRGAAAAAAPAGPGEDPPAAAAGSAARPGNSPPGSAKQGKARTRVLEELLSRWAVCVGSGGRGRPRASAACEAARDATMLTVHPILWARAGAYLLSRTPLPACCAVRRTLGLVLVFFPPAIRIMSPIEDGTGYKYR